MKAWNFDIKFSTTTFHYYSNSNYIVFVQIDRALHADQQINMESVKREIAVPLPFQNTRKCWCLNGRLLECLTDIVSSNAGRTIVFQYNLLNTCSSKMICSKLAFQSPIELSLPKKKQTTFEFLVPTDLHTSRGEYNSDRLIRCKHVFRFWNRQPCDRCLCSSLCFWNWSNLQLVLML